MQSSAALTGKPNLAQASSTHRAPTRQPDAHQSPTGLGRTNDQWLGDLRSVGRPERETAVGDLSRYLRSSLGKALNGSSNVDETDLDDFTQDAIVRILGGLDSFRGNSRFTTWATAVALRTAYTALRRRRSAHVSLTDIEEWAHPDSMSPPGYLPADRHVERSDLLEALSRAIFERLTERQRTVILAELEGVTSERVADLLGTNRNALYKVYHDARRNLRRALIEAGFSREDVRELVEKTG